MKAGFFATISVVIFTCFANLAQADLLVSPTHISFDGRERAKEIILVNTGNETRTYRVEWQQKRALAEGGYTDLDDSEAGAFPTASQMIRFSPKQVTLKANERQVVKLALRKPKNLVDGEYRSHLMLRALPPRDKPQAEPGKFAIDLKLRMSYSLPVIVRQGNSDVKLTFEQVKFEYDQNKQKGNIQVKLSRNGLHSSFGNILAYWTPKSGGTKELVARINSYSIYAELTEARVNLIWLGENFNPTDGTLSLEYEGADAYNGQILSQKEFSYSKANLQP